MTPDRRENFDAREAIDAIKGAHRGVVIDLLRDAERLDAERVATIARLTTEVRRLNRLVTEQAKQLELSDYRHTKEAHHVEAN